MALACSLQHPKEFPRLCHVSKKEHTLGGNTILDFRRVCQVSSPQMSEYGQRMCHPDILCNHDIFLVSGLLLQIHCKK